MPEPTTTYDTSVAEIARALILGISVEAADPDLAPIVGTITAEQVEWISRWLASEGVGRLPAPARPTAASLASLDSLAAVVEPHWFSPFPPPEGPPSPASLNIARRVLAAGYRPATDVSDAERDALTQEVVDLTLTYQGQGRGGPHDAIRSEIDRVFPPTTEPTTAKPTSRKSRS